MNSLVDPVKIILIGSGGVGKSSIVRRLAGHTFEDKYLPTTGIDVANMKVLLKDSAFVDVSIIDTGAELMQSCPGSTMSLLCAGGVDCAIIVADGGNARSILDVNRWLNLITQHGSNKLDIHLVISKADIPASGREFSPIKLSSVIKDSAIGGWSWTVSNPEFGDMDIARGCIEHQRAPEDVIRTIIHTVLVNRAGNVCKLFPVPFRLQFVQLTSFPFPDVDKYFSSATS